MSSRNMCLLPRATLHSDNEHGLSVSDNADSELALYLTALIQNQRCIWQRWFTNFHLRIRISPRIWNRIWKYFRVWIRGPYVVNLWKNSGQKSRATVPLRGLKPHGKSLPNHLSSYLEMVYYYSIYFFCNGEFVQTILPSIIELLQNMLY